MDRRNRPRWGRGGPAGPWRMPFFGPGRRFGGPPGMHFWFGPEEGPPFDPRGGPHGGPHGEDPFGHGGRRRQRRGDIKYALLELIAERPRHGYELIKELEQRYGGFYRPSPGSVYPTLQLLEEEGHLSGELVEGKRIYTITDTGRKLLEERQAGPGGPWGGPRGGRGPMPGGPELHELRERMGALMGVVAQVAQHGTPAQVQALNARLDELRRELYRIMADGEAAE
jgi:DNA-binding PadR family transcriptional regulator